MYTLQDRIKAVNLYLQWGRNSAAVRRELGYPSKKALRLWVKEYEISGSLHDGYRPRKPKYSEEQKQAAVKHYPEHGRNLQRSIRALGYPNKGTFRQWLDEVVPDREGLHSKRRLQPKVEFTPEQKQAAVLDLGTRDGSAREVAEEYGVTRAALSIPDKYAELREQVRTLFAQVDGRYGYRRIHVVLTRDGRTVSEKVVRRLMREQNLVVVGLKKRRYSSYLGEISPPVPNVIERDFHADAPNIKWLTDLTEFALPAGKVYLSPMIDCFDGMAISWSVGTSPDANMANSMLDNAIATLGEGERPVVHSDRGSHYRWPGRITRMEAAGLTRPMSKKGCSPDNAACEGFFGRVKNDVFYGRSWAGVSVGEFMRTLDRYLHWHNEERIKMSLGGRSPMEYRRALGYA